VIEYNASAIKIRQAVTADVQRRFRHLDAYFFGTKDKPNRSDVIISTYNEMPESMQKLQGALAGAGLRVNLSDMDCENGDVDEYPGINVGLNRRIRDDVAISKRVVLTILTALQGNLAYDCRLTMVRKPTAEVAEAAPRRRRVSKGAK
jgi:hypothetical protein